MKNFFNVLEINNHKVTYTLNKPSAILKQNIHVNWLKFINSKSHKILPVFINVDNIDGKVDNKLPFAVVKENILKHDYVFHHDLNEYAPKNQSQLKLSLTVPQQDSMQYFIQWQRYRKYWWSSITTTPSLFSISDIKYEEKSAAVNIVAQFEDPKTVETLTLDTAENNINHSSCLTCTMTLEGALFILLLDGLTNYTQEDYLRLHRDMAPFKISFALNYEDSNQKLILNDLATLLYHKLKLKNISAILPTFSLPLVSQVQENLHMGVVYTAILNENTLSSGIFHLLNSSTMLKEQVHVADFDTYAAILCGK